MNLKESLFIFSIILFLFISCTFVLLFYPSEEQPGNSILLDLHDKDEFIEKYGENFEEKFNFQNFSLFESCPIINEMINKLLESQTNFLFIDENENGADCLFNILLLQEANACFFLFEDYLFKLEIVWS